VICVKWFCFEVKWVALKLLGTKVQCTLGWLLCDYFIWCVSCTVVVLTCFVMCGCVFVCVGFVMSGCFGNMCTCIYWVFVLFRLCIFILFMFLFDFASYVFFNVMIMYSYCYVCSVLYILFSPCQLALFSYPDWVFSVLFPQL